MAMDQNKTLPHYEIDESEKRYNIDSMNPDSDEWKNLWTKHIMIWEEWARYWKPRFEVGKQCMDFTRREIFTPGQRKKYYYVYDKYPIEPQVIRPVIDALAGEISSMVRSSSISMEDSTPPENVAPPEVVNIVLKNLFNKLKIESKKKKALRSGLITGYPQCLYFSRKKVVEGGLGKLDSTLLPWDSVLYQPYYQEDDGSDIYEMMIVSKRFKSELLESFPGRAKMFESHKSLLKDDPGRFSQLFNYQNNVSSDLRSRVYFDMVMSESLAEENGYYTVIEHLFPVKQNRTVYLNPDTEHAVTLPEAWSAAKKEEWLYNNPDYSHTIKDKVSTLWCTTIGSNGFIWENERHWFQQAPFDEPQKSLLPAAIFVPDMIDNVPMGKVEDMLPLVLMKAVCETEGLSEVRKGTNKTVFYTEGSIRHPGTITHEMSLDVGAVCLKKGAVYGQDVKVEQSTPNRTFYDLSDRIDAQLEATHRINQTIQGVSAPRQSGVAKDREINQGLMVQSPYVDNYTNFILNISQMTCYMFPYFLTEKELITVEDDFGDMQQTEVNVPQIDTATGKITSLANDLISAHYRIVPVTGDDSQISREKQMAQFAELLEAFGNSLLNIEPTWFANFLSSLPNKYARECGKFMRENAAQMQQSQAQQAQAEQQFEKQKLDDRKQIEYAKILTPRLMMKTDSKDIQEAPMGFQIFTQLIDALQNKMPPMQTPQPVPQMPQEQAQPEMAGTQA